MDEYEKFHLRRDFVFCILLHSVSTSSWLVSLSWFPIFYLFYLYLQHATQTGMPPEGFKPAIPASNRLQTLALDRSATGIGRIRSPNRPGYRELLYRLSYRGLPLPCLYNTFNPNLQSLFFLQLYSVCFLPTFVCDIRWDALLCELYFPKYAPKIVLVSKKLY